MERAHTTRASGASEDGLPDSLLRFLRRSLDCAELAYAEAPAEIHAGAEADVYRFRLAGAPGGYSGPLILRRVRNPNGLAGVRWLQTVHQTLVSLDYPVPRVLLAHEDGQPLGAPFVVMERVDGRMLLEEVTRPDQLLAQPLRIPGLIREAVVGVPRVLARMQARLHDLDVTALQRALAAAGLPEREITVEGKLDDLEGRLQGASLDGLAPALEWLRRKVPTGAERAICHGDLVFSNMLVDGERVAGVFDWSQMAIAEPAYDVGQTCALLTSPVVGVPWVLRALFVAVQRLMRRSFLRAYQRLRPVRAEAVRYFEIFRLTEELVWAGELIRQGKRPGPEIEERWLHPQAYSQGLEQIRAWTGVQVSAPWLRDPRPDGASEPEVVEMAEAPPC